VQKSIEFIGTKKKENLSFLFVNKIIKENQSLRNPILFKKLFLNITFSPPKYLHFFNKFIHKKRFQKTLTALTIERQSMSVGIFVFHRYLITVMETRTAIMSNIVSPDTIHRTRVSVNIHWNLLGRCILLFISFFFIY